MKTVMVDFDNTLVDFNFMFKKALSYYYNIDYTVYPILEYDLSKFLSRWWNKEEIPEIFDQVFHYKDFYYPLYLSPYFGNIIDKIKLYRDKGYKVILYSKCPNSLMKEAKTRAIQHVSLNKLFDEMILEITDGLHKPLKPTDYQVIIDDSPSVIENYLQKNKRGKVYLPLCPYNEYLTSKYSDRIQILDSI